MQSDDPLIAWAKSELRRLDAEERFEASKKAYEERELKRMERYLNAPSMGLDGKMIGGKSLSEGEKNKP